MHAACSELVYVPSFGELGMALSMAGLGLLVVMRGAQMLHPSRTAAS
jgi:hypothetical protein